MPASVFCVECLCRIREDKTFTMTGFCDWQHAIDKSKGLCRQTDLTLHQQAMTTYEENKFRKASNFGTVASSFVSTRDDQKKWLFAVFNVKEFSCANGLLFRGTNESEIETADDLFLRTFSQLLFPLKPEWRQMHNNLPKNATYTSHDIRNEVIETMAILVKRKIAEEIRQAVLFTIMADGTTDKNGEEVQGLVCPYLSADGKLKVHCLYMKGIHDRSAKGIFGFVKESLEEFNILQNGLVSLSFDGASVMSGDYGGLQRLISDYCDRYILYVHCFLHNIHLIVTSVVRNLEEIKEHFAVLTTKPDGRKCEGTDG